MTKKEIRKEAMKKFADNNSITPTSWTIAERSFGAGYDYRQPDIDELVEALKVGIQIVSDTVYYAKEISNIENLIKKYENV
jgi:hypothetical protein